MAEWLRRKILAWLMQGDTPCIVNDRNYITLVHCRSVLLQNCEDVRVVSSIVRVDASTVVTPEAS